MVSKTKLMPKVMAVTPELATKWLKNNNTNRSLSIKKVRQYADMMKRGGWQLNGEAIEISASGKLKNGQHRLNAVIMSGCSIFMLVVFGVSDEVSVYDRGRSRNTTDVLRIEGMPPFLANNPTIGAVRLHYWVQKWNDSVSDDEIRDFLLSHADSLEAIHEALPSTKKKGTVNVNSSVFILAALYALESGVPIDVIQLFFDCVSTGLVNDISQHAAVVLRNDIVVENTFKAKGTTAERRTMVFKVEKALFDFSKGVPRKQSYSAWNKPVYSSNELFKLA